jgi:hypothetical protein
VHPLCLSTAISGPRGDAAQHDWLGSNVFAACLPTNGTLPEATHKQERNEDRW